MPPISKGPGRFRMVAVGRAGARFHNLPGRKRALLPQSLQVGAGRTTVLAGVGPSVSPKGAYTKWERVCQEEKQQRPLLAEWALSQTYMRGRELWTLFVQHRIFTCIAEEVGHRAGEFIYWPIEAVIQHDAYGMQDESGPAPDVIIDW